MEPAPYIDREMLDQMVTFMARHECWAAPEETAEWLKTDQGQRIQAKIAALRQTKPPSGKKTRERSLA